MNRKFFIEMRAAWKTVTGTTPYWIMRRCLRVAQVAVVGASIYQAGFANGLTTFAENGWNNDESTFQSSFLSEHSLNASSTTFCDEENHVYEEKRIQTILSKISASAQQMCITKMTTASQDLALNRKRLSKLKHSVYAKEDIMNTFADFDEAVMTYGQWSKALEAVEGPWKTVLTRNKQEINAYVSDIHPRVLFVEYGLLCHMEPTDDELAMIIGHEISHRMLGHSISETRNNATAKMLQLLFLSCVDPGGLLSFALEILSFESCNIFASLMSTRNEFEADSLGQKLMASAGYSATMGTQIFLKESVMSSAAGTSNIPWRVSHPDSVERYYRLAAERIERQISSL